MSAGSEGSAGSRGRQENGNKQRDREERNVIEKGYLLFASIKSLFVQMIERSQLSIELQIFCPCLVEGSKEREEEEGLH